jgi:hypothetical protein
VLGVHYYMTELDDEHEHPVGETLRRYFEQQVTPEVRARHTMAIHREAARIRIAEQRTLRVARRPRRAAVASLVGAMLVGSSTGALAASDDALPGDLLYTVKRGSEQARLFAAAPFSAMGDVHLDIAKTRVAEAQAAATERPGVVPQLVEETQKALQAAESEGVNVAAVAPELEEAAQAALVLAKETAPDEVIGLLPSASTPAPPAASPSPSPSNPAVASPAPSIGASPAPTATGPETGTADPAATPIPGAAETSTVVQPASSPSPTVP